MINQKDIEGSGCGLF